MIAFAMLSNIAHSAGAKAAADADVRYVIDNRAALSAKEIVVTGFLYRWGNYYFLQQGQSRPGGQLGSRGEKFFCGAETSPSTIWFLAGEGTSAQWDNVPTIDEGGRRAVVSGVFHIQPWPGTEPEHFPPTPQNYVQMPEGGLRTSIFWISQAKDVADSSGALLLGAIR